MIGSAADALMCSKKRPTQRPVITDLAPSGTYTITVNANVATHTATVTAGGNLHASANGALSFALTPGGVGQP